MTFKLMIKQHNKTGLKYLCITRREDYEKYRGSGKYWQNHLKKFGNDVKTELLYETDDYLQFVIVCKETSENLNVALSEEFANLVPEIGYNDSNEVDNNFTLFWEYASENTKKEIFEKRKVKQKENHWTHSDFSEEIKKTIGKKFIERWKNLSLDERRLLMQYFWEGSKNFHENKQDEKYEKWRKALSQAQKEHLANVPFEVLSEKNRKARLNTPENVKQRRKKKIQDVYASGKHDKLFERYSKERKGCNNPSAKKILWYGEELTKSFFEKNIGKLHDESVVKIFETRDDCKILFNQEKKEYEMIQCPFCKKTTNKIPSSFKRWHFENCKEKT